ncbi:histidinol-phosphatase [Marinilabilia rubra]|nr:histidinol-phosphatase [Marinilabilia rubra]
MQDSLHDNSHSLKNWANYHGHCFFCDGKQEPEVYVKKAIEWGMTVLGISSHAPVGFDTDWNMKEEKLSEYLKVLSHLKEKYKERIKLLTSMEVDYIPGEAGPSHQRVVNANLDYIVGSVHFVEAYDDGTHFSIDDSTEDFTRGLNQIFGGDIQKLVKRYFELQKEMIANEPPHILGHMDKIRMHNRNRFFFDEKDKWYLDEVRSTMKLAAEKGVVVEINTKYFERADFSFPSRDHFRWMGEEKIPVTLNSDAHHPDKLLSGFKEILEMVENSGITELWHYHGNGQTFVPKRFSRDTIKW